MKRLTKALGRARYLWVMAFLFRIQLYLFGWGQTSADDLFTVDILNCMGLAMTVHSFLALVPGAARGRLSLLLGLGIAFFSPVIASMNWKWLHPNLAHYFVPDANFFTFFPWAAYISFGIAFGTAIRLCGPDHLSSVMTWGALLATPLIFGSQYFSNLPFTLYENSNFWVDGPGLVLIKTGICLILISAAYLWTHTYPHGSWSWVIQMGRASMVVYWVHIELVYGRWLGAWKGALPIYAVEILFVAMTCLMLSLAMLKSQWYDRFDFYSLFRKSEPDTVNELASPHPNL